MEVFNEIKIRAEKFENKNSKYGLHYLIGFDKDDDQVTEIDGHHSYCDDCIEVVLNEYDKKLKEQSNELNYNCEDERFKDVVNLEMVEEGSPERDDFCYCDNCGNLISTVGVLHTFTQEIDHWLDDDVSVDLNELEDRDCFILNELIENADFPQLISQLKQKIELGNV